MRGIAMLLVVLQHTMSGCTVGAENTFLFNIAWSLQMPLFILISGYVTKYSRPISDSKGLWKYVKRRTVAYMLPWAVWSFLVRGIIFGQDGFLNVKHLLWNMDSGYWFLATIWTISMIFGVASFVAERASKENLLKKQIVLLGCYLAGMVLLVGIGVILGLSFFAIKLTLLSLYIACSKYGDIVLGEPNEKPQYSFFAWGSMMFTCGLAADILFYSFSEWVLYATDPHLAEMGSIQDWAGVYPLFHWSFIPWGFYLVLAVAFGFMLHVRKRTRQKYSEACRPILGKHTDGWAGRIIDLLAVFALLAGTATTFSVATPLMATIIGELFHVAVSRTVINIIILLITCAVYTYSLLHGFKGISKLANVCIYLFFGFSKYASTGDGILTSLKMMEVMLAKKLPMSKLAEPLKIYPQVLENVRVTDKKAAQNDPAVQEAVRAVAEALGDTGRILVRESGTEPLVRVMVEALDHDTCQKYVSQVVEVIKAKGYVV